jgi:hypothetical protein
MAISTLYSLAPRQQNPFDAFVQGFTNSAGIKGLLGYLENKDTINTFRDTSMSDLAPKLMPYKQYLGDAIDDTGKVVNPDALLNLQNSDDPLTKELAKSVYTAYQNRVQFNQLPLIKQVNLVQNPQAAITSMTIDPNKIQQVTETKQKIQDTVNTLADKNPNNPILQAIKVNPDLLNNPQIMAALSLGMIQGNNGSTDNSISNGNTGGN